MTRICPASVQDLPRIAQCHRKSFPHALSSAMGQKYVEKMLEWYLIDHRAFMFYLEVGQECIGYCGGLIHDGKTRVGSASSMIQHSFNKAVLTFVYKPWLFFHPEFMSKYKLAFRNVWKRIRKLLGAEQPVKISTENKVLPHVGLIVIGVDPRFQGKGYGTIMLKEFEKRSREAGFQILQLTVRSDNLQAIKSYQRNGWSITENQGKSTSMEKRLV